MMAYVGAELAGQIGDAVVDAIDERRDGDDRGDADDDAENGEAGAEFIGAQGVQRHADGFAGIAEGHGL
ncbi:MAG: hypothetical protein ABSA94_16420 [Acidobacteriaceae bacterium]